MKHRRLVFLGDSITEGFGDSLSVGWVGRMARELNGETGASWTISNLGVHGDTIADGKYRLATALQSYPTHIILAFGTNDLSQIIWPDNTGTKLSLAYAKQIWIAIMEQLKPLKIKVSVIGTLPVVEEKLPFTFIPFDDEDKGYFFKNENQKKYNAMLAEVCSKYDVPVVDLFNDWEKRDLDKLLCDGLHPGEDGYDLLSFQIMTHLSEIDFFD